MPQAANQAPRFPGESPGDGGLISFMSMVELLVMRLALWIGLPLLLVVLALGPRRVWRSALFGWDWLVRRRLKPEEILSQVLKQHQKQIVELRRLLSQQEKAEAQIEANLAQTSESLSELETQAIKFSDRGDSLGARAALYKINLERAANESFREQLARQRDLIEDSRRRLYMLELQLRQYEVGRSILLSQLAAAERVEQQYAIAKQFDPFNAVANWRQAENLVEQKTLKAKAIERVYRDTSDGVNAPADPAAPLAVDEAAIAREVARLREQAMTHDKNHRPNDG